MTQRKSIFEINKVDNSSLKIELEIGDILYVLGGNGVGKSTLMHNIYQKNQGYSKRILAHRQTWFNDNSINMTASQKKQQEKQIKNSDSQISSRFTDSYAQVRSSISVFDLIDSHNIRARNISEAVDINDIELAKNLSSSKSPLKQINEILSISNIPIELFLEKNEQLFASKKGCPKYSIAELSDGERNALLICADVLTTEPNNLIILDEPERHLHRSIISPLLTTLFHARKDCTFIISTHDVSLPNDYPDSKVLLVRDCIWNGKAIEAWDIDYLVENTEIPLDIKHTILGSKRELLFVEGDRTSLDKQIYQQLYPNVSIIPVGSCTLVEKAIVGLKNTQHLHWIIAYGLIDSDDRTEEQIANLYSQGIASLNSYSVESLYYQTEVIKMIADRISATTGEDSKELYLKSTNHIIQDISSHKDRLCSRMCEKAVRNEVYKVLPKHNDILTISQFDFSFDLNKFLTKEKLLFDQLIQSNDINGLISRYPIRETPVLSNIVKELGLTRKKYENSVRKLISDKPEAKEYFKKLLEPLTKLIDKNYT